ncbi:MAG: winged helix-turn-helix domain-containing tetratricopeptide repeat protein [Steroidobacteraceae bacterium]
MASTDESATKAAPRRYRIDDLDVDVEQRRVTRAGQQLSVTGISFDLLLALLRTAPNLVPIDELMQRVWPGLIVSPETVSQRVKILRRALGDDAEQSRYIAGVRGRGYRMAAPVRSEDSLHAGVLAAPALSISGKRPGRRVVTSMSAFALAAAAIAAVLHFRSLPPHAQVSMPRAAAPGTATASAPRTAVAVLPFVNLTGDPAKDYIGDGMAEELIDSLTKIPGLKVPARTSSFVYKLRNTDARQIARDLGVGTLLEGSVREAGSRIRVTAQLIDAKDGLNLWSESYDRKFTDVFALEDDLATAIVQALKINLRGASPVPIAYSPPTADIAAYDLYLQGEAFLDHPTSRGFARAADYLQRAVTKDPGFARAFALLGTAKFLAASRDVQPLANMAAAERAASRAMELDPTLSETAKVLSNIARLHFRFLDAELHNRAAIALDPGDPTVHLSEGWLLDEVGHLREALAEQDLAMRLAPANLAVLQLRSYAAVLLERDADAQANARFAQELGMPAGNFGLVYEQTAMRAHHFADAGAAALSRFDVRNPDQRRTAEIYRRVYAALADPRLKAQALAARARLYPHVAAPAISNVWPCLSSGFAFGLIGELDTAFDLSNRCIDEMAPGGMVKEPSSSGAREWASFVGTHALQR